MLLHDLLRHDLALSDIEFKEEVTEFLCTVDSRYLELRYLEFCETRSVFLDQKYIFIAFTNHNFALENFFYKSKLPEVQINLRFGQFELVKNSHRSDESKCVCVR